MNKHIKKFIFIVLLNFCWTSVHAEPKYPVDISYLVTDFKYSREHGIKICEVQHGILSALRGDAFVTGGNGNIPIRFAKFFNQFPMKKWVVGSMYKPLMSILSANRWSSPNSFDKLKRNSAFLKYARTPPADPYSISSYAGIVYGSRYLVNNLDQVHKDFPGIIFLDSAVMQYWIDKYKVNSLFSKNEELKPFKADWKLYPKGYDPFLAERIQEDMPSDIYVIKPRGEFLGNGVIIVASEDLDEVLQLILEPNLDLQTNPNPSYAYWSKNNDETFLIEKYYKSDYLQFVDKLSERGDAIPTKYGANFHYDATMRIVFLMEYEKGEMHYHCLGAYWKLPCKAIEENGTMNEKHISFGEVPFYRSVDPELFEEINAQMEKAMLLLYEEMLNDVEDAEAEIVN